MTDEDIVAVEVSTRGQADNKAWQEARQYHITSSRFGAICKATDKRDMHKLAQDLITPHPLNTAPILHGRKYESVAVEKFEQKMGLTTHECGLFVSKDYPQLAASPDRVVDTDCVLEVKCPFTARDKLVNAVNVPYLKEVNGTLTLDEKHDYYYQIQGQLLCTNRSLCYFVVYTKKDVQIFPITRDNCFIQEMVKKLLSFYNSFFRNTLLNKHFYNSYYSYNFEYE